MLISFHLLPGCTPALSGRFVFSIADAAANMVFRPDKVEQKTNYL